MPNTTPKPEEIQGPLCEKDEWEIITHPEFAWKVTDWFGDRFYATYIYRFLPLGYLNELMNNFTEGTDPDDREIMLAISKNQPMRELLEDYLTELNIALLMAQSRSHFLENYERLAKTNNLCGF